MPIERLLAWPTVTALVCLTAAAGLFLLGMHARRTLRERQKPL